MTIPLSWRQEIMVVLLIQFLFYSLLGIVLGVNLYSSVVAYRSANGESLTSYNSFFRINHKLNVIEKHLQDREAASNSKPGGRISRMVYAYVTGYNSVAGQTDSTPCQAAGGFICGRADVVACPGSIPLHTVVEIKGKRFTCFDRTSRKFRNRFDIFYVTKTSRVQRKSRAGKK